MIAVRYAQGSRPGSSVYSIRKDIDGSGTIFGNDLIAVRDRQGTRLPAGEPVVPTTASSREVLMASSNSDEPPIFASPLGDPISTLQTA